jgi:peptide/nickel transport system substrate-binding protein
MLISRRAALLAPSLLAAPALAQADNRPTLTIAVQRLSNSNTFEPPREQSNVGSWMRARSISRCAKA